ncbi:hypothetical protein MVEN_00313800 [Mycena venus]|uniref:Uncharacterized protein n=1 Tax=Mycena venus TaxID=2733690 RepID=A0A8H6Z3S8_9AGAR|nr:hypothetical protein MVEN_00313800 [Mycena venus]
MPTDVVSLKRRKQNIILYVGSDNELNRRLFCFEKGPHSLVIQAPELNLPGYIFGLDPEADKVFINSHFAELTKISTLVKSLEFGKTNWAYLVTRKDGSIRLHYKEKPIYSISCPPWAPLIPEEDIVYTKYITAEDREALWNGRLVDCLVGWNDQWRLWVDYAMKGHRLLDGLDVTFQVIGHITRNGVIIGIMTEHAGDERRIEHRDRAAVYAAVAKVQSKGLIIGVNESNVVIHKGKVRFLDAQSVRKFSEFTDIDATIANYHWQALSAVFDQLKQHPNFIPLLRSWQNDGVPFIPVPAPEKPLGSDFFFRLIVYALRMRDEDELGPSPPSRKTRPRPSALPYTRIHSLGPCERARDTYCNTCV